MLLPTFYKESDTGIIISPEQASRFAKEIAGDFNPIHDVGAKRFCVPGDLLFALVLERYGLSETMGFRFSGMVGEGVVLQFPATQAQQFSITDAAGRSYLEVERSGASLHQSAIVGAFIQAYVAFSGQNFPQVLVPLLREQGVMINPERPLVIYEQMQIELSGLDVDSLLLEPDANYLDIQGKRAEVRLGFRILNDKEGVLTAVGRGFKKLIVSGLKAYDEASSVALIEQYLTRKRTYEHALVRESAA